LCLPKIPSFFIYKGLWYVLFKVVNCKIPEFFEKSPLLMSRVELLKPGSGMEGNGRDVPRQWEEAGSWRNWLAFLVFFKTQFVWPAGILLTLT
jgi:hypothetical protein